LSRWARIRGYAWGFFGPGRKANSLAGRSSSGWSASTDGRGIVKWKHPIHREQLVTQRVQILIVDDQPRARQSLRALLSTWPSADEVREAADGREAVQLLETWQPDVVLMDVRMPRMDGLEATRFIKARWLRVRVVVLTLYGEYEAEALAAGADAFIGKGEPPGRLLSVLSSLAAWSPL
jgi:CheY-like chemotaxis protein